VDNVNDRVDKLVEEIADDTDNALKYARISYWVLLGFGILLFILLFYILIVLCC